MQHAHNCNSVMAALVAAIHFPEAYGLRQWMAGTSPAMTKLLRLLESKAW